MQASGALPPKPEGNVALKIAAHLRKHKTTYKKTRRKLFVLVRCVCESERTGERTRVKKGNVLQDGVCGGPRCRREEDKEGRVVH